MTDITLGAAPAAPRFDWPFLAGAVAAVALLMALVLLDGQPASAALLLFGKEGALRRFRSQSRSGIPCPERS